MSPRAGGDVSVPLVVAAASECGRGGSGGERELLQVLAAEAGRTVTLRDSPAARR